MNKKWKLILQAISYLFILTAVSACGTNHIEQVLETELPANILENVVELPEDDEFLSEQVEVEETEIDVSPIPIEEVKPLELGKLAWFQSFFEDSSRLSYTILFDNPNQVLTFFNPRYQVVAYDEDDNVLTTTGGIITQISPGETLGVSDSVFVDSVNRITRIEVNIDEGDPETAQFENIIISDVVFIRPDRDAYTRAVITNPNEFELRSLRFSIVLFDSSGEIVGGGLNFLSFINPNSSVGLASLFYNFYEEIEDEDITPVYYLGSFEYTQREVPHDSTELIVTDIGFMSPDNLDNTEGWTGYGFTLNNPNEDYIVTDLTYQITAYGPNNKILFTEGSSSFAMTPNQTLKIGGFMENPTRFGITEVVDRIDVQIQRGRFIESELLPFFESENVEYSYQTVTGTIYNPFPEDANVHVYAILYDENGDIIGGMMDQFTTLYADTKSDVEIWLWFDLPSEPSYAELYVSFVFWPFFLD